MSELVCPHCGGELDLSLDIQAQPLEKRKSPYEDWKAQLHEDDRLIIEMADRLGITKAFEDAKREHMSPALPPKNAGKCLLNFLTHMRRWNLPGLPAIQILTAAQFPKEQVDIWAWDGIAAIVCSGLLTLFVPEQYLKQPAVQASVAGRIKIADISMASSKLGGWVKSRNGYVPTEARTFLSEMQKRTPGHFANLGNF